MILALAACFAHAVPAETLEGAAWNTPWALRICPAAGVAPITRARVTIDAFLSPVDGWGPRDGLAALLSWTLAADVRGGPIVAFRAAIEAAMDHSSSAPVG